MVVALVIPWTLFNLVCAFLPLQLFPQLQMIVDRGGTDSGDPYLFKLSQENLLHKPAQNPGREVVASFKTSQTFFRKALPASQLLALTE